MGELESAIVEWVSKNDEHGRGYIGDVFTNKGYPFADIETAIDRLLAEKVLTLEDGWVKFTFLEETASYAEGMQKMLNMAMTPKGGFSNQLLTPSHDAVNSPSHYTRGGIEAIDFIEAKGLGFCLGNVVKYVSRAGFKADAKIQDLEKARWYLNREIERLKAGE